MVEQDFQLLDKKLDEISKKFIFRRAVKRSLFGFIEFGLENQSHYEIMFLIKDSELKECLADSQMLVMKNLQRLFFFM